jgi:hypothetical protein
MERIAACIKLAEFLDGVAFANKIETVWLGEAPSTVTLRESDVFTPISAPGKFVVPYGEDIASLPAGEPP